MVIKRRFEEPKAGPVPDSLYGDDWLGDIYQVVVGGRQDVGWQGWLDFPVGLGAPSVFIQRDRVPALVPATAQPPPPSLPPPTPSGDEPFVKEVIQKVAVSWSDYMAAGNALPADWSNYPHASDHPGTNVAATAAVRSDGLVESQEEDVSILGDIYDVIDTGLGGILPGGVPFAGFGAPTSPAAQIYSGAGTMQQMANAPGSTTVIPGTGGPVSAACGPVMIYNSATGKWSKKRRRRRRQLATRSDIRDLSALKGVLGQGKLLEVWIATHS